MSDYRVVVYKGGELLREVLIAKRAGFCRGHGEFGWTERLADRDFEAELLELLGREARRSPAITYGTLRGRRLRVRGAAPQGARLKSALLRPRRPRLRRQRPGAGFAAGGRGAQAAAGEAGS